MKWQKSPPELVALFDEIFPGPPAEQRKMFGYPAGFVNGNLFFSLFENDLVLRLPEEERTKLVASGKAKPFEPMPGRPMREYVAVPGALTAPKKELAGLAAKCLAYGKSLEPKSKSAKPKKFAARSKAAISSKRSRT
jgi:TfoX/Sxy family transcriptional regulator of competence genes